MKLKEAIVIALLAGNLSPIIALQTQSMSCMASGSTSSTNTETKPSIMSKIHKPITAALATQ